jgi:HD-GYP domain-containing protein (c-di-GMP phosphodiesterase class II)
MTKSGPAPISIQEHLVAAHENLRANLPEIGRIAAALYDSHTDQLKTFVNSTEGGSPLTHYEARLSDVPSLKELGESGRDRVVHDLSVFAESEAEHSRVLLQRYGSSYTRPLYENGRLRGFLFFDAEEKGFFTPAVVQRLGVYADFVALLLSSSLFPLRMLKSAVRVASSVTHSRDPETGAHLDRMARYSRIVAMGVAAEFGLDDAFVEYLFIFAPLHDLGKVAVPDRVLLKKGRLDEEEYRAMQLHVTRGTEMVDRVLEDLGVETIANADMLRNVVRHHHERFDGKGYVDGLAGEAIPIEARIVTVADVFDALTSTRPYKEAWTFDEAFDHMREHAGTQFDPRCVDALLESRAQLEEIRETFPDAPESPRLREGYGPEL